MAFRHGQAGAHGSDHGVSVPFGPYGETADALSAIELREFLHTVISYRLQQSELTTTYESYAAHHSGAYDPIVSTYAERAYPPSVDAIAVTLGATGAYQCCAVIDRVENKEMGRMGKRSACPWHTPREVRPHSGGRTRRCWLDRVKRNL